MTNKPITLKGGAKPLFIAFLSNLLEVYDYVLFGAMIPIFAQKFFPSGNSELALLLSYIGFAITFIITPFGSFFWGYVGDKYGRAFLLKYSIIFMALPSFFIGLLPTYESIGIFAPMLLFTLRIFQGFSASGEVTGAKIYALENVEPKHHGFASGIISVGASSGVLLAMLSGSLLTQMEELGEYWRIPFLISILLYGISFLIRSRLLKNYGKLGEIKNYTSAFGVIGKRKKESTLAFFMGAGLGVMSYTLFAFVVPFMTKNGFTAHAAYTYLIFALAATAVSSFIFGILFDYLKDKNYLFILILTVSAAISAVSIMGILRNPEFVLVMMGIAHGAYASIIGVFNFRMFNTEERCRGLLVSHNFGVCIFGGTIPLVHNYLAGINLHYPSLYLASFYIVIMFIFASVRKRVSLS